MCQARPWMPSLNQGCSTTKNISSQVQYCCTAVRKINTSINQYPCLAWFAAAVQAQALQVLTRKVGLDYQVRPCCLCTAVSATHWSEPRLGRRALWRRTRHRVKITYPLHPRNNKAITRFCNSYKTSDLSSKTHRVRARSRKRGSKGHAIK